MSKSTPSKIVVFVASALVALGCLSGTARAAEHVEQHMPVLTSPTRHEGAHINTELRLMHVYTKVPRGFILAAGKGNVDTLTMQGRFAVNDRWAIMVRKFGYQWANFQNALLPDADGFANFTLGAKYAILAEPSIGRYLTVGGSYEAPVGDVEAGLVELQGGGSGMFDTFVSWSSRVGEKTSFQSSLGFDMALDSDHDSSFFHYTFHVDHMVLPRVYALFEGNLLTTIGDGDRTDSAIFGSFEGYDLFNFGNTDSGTVATLGGGIRFRISDYLILGGGVEFPVTGREDVIDLRAIGDVVIQF